MTQRDPVLCRDGKVVIVGADKAALSTLQAQLELSGLRDRVSVVVNDRHGAARFDAPRPGLVIWHDPEGGEGNHNRVHGLKTEGVSMIVIGGHWPEVDAVLPRSYEIQDLLQTVARYVDLPLPAEIAEPDRASDGLSEEETRYRDLFERASDAILLIDFETHIIIDASHQAESLYGYDRSELIGMSLLQIVAPAEHAEIWQNTQYLGTGDELTIRIGKRTHLKKDSTPLTVSVSASLFTYKGRRIFQDIVRDQTRRLDREVLLEQLLDSAPDPTVIVDADGKIQFANSQLQATFGYTRDELINQPIEILIPERLAARHVGRRESYSANPQPREMGSGFELCGQTKDGLEIPIEVSLAPVRGHGQPLVSAAIRDITERKRIRDALRTSEQRFKDFADTAADWFWEMDADLRFTFLSERFEDVVGRPPDDVLGKTQKDLFQQANIDEEKWQTHVQSLKGRRSFQNFEYELARPDGQRRIVNVSGKPVFDATGKFQGYRGVAQDVTRQRELDRTLRESHKVLEERVEERTRELEHQQDVLHQAQKMETLGQLTGGVAHDFNNLLTAIMGNLEMLEAWHGGDKRSEKAIGQAQEAAELGAQLTGRLLAFARRQPLEPKVLVLNDVVLEMGDLLVRTLGEAIEINTVLANPLNNTLIDPAQVQNALLNLAVNARDAMPNGGKLTIETANAELDQDYARDHPDVTAGDYILLSVSDTGTGMAPEIRDRVFEPFFTTKDVGKGSGLGLSMVYGFIKQSGGHVRLYSEVGYGTTISLYLPKAQDADTVAEAPTPAAEIPQARRETVLVVEDDARVRQVTVQRLETLGYTVLEADNGQAALDLLKASPAVDLLFTDVVMPGGMSGIDLAQEVHRLYPKIKVLLTSGYSEHSGIEHRAEGDDTAWLQKPYKMAELARRVRDVLGG